MLLFPTVPVLGPTERLKATFEAGHWPPGVCHFFLPSFYTSQDQVQILAHVFDPAKTGG